MRTRVPILVVEDDPDIREIIREVLECDGCHVEVASSCGEALVRLRLNYRPAVILVDFRLPDGTGADLVRGYKEDPNLRAIPAIMMSAATDLAPHGVEAYLHKPFGREELLDQVAPPAASTRRPYRVLPQGLKIDNAVAAINTSKPPTA